VFTHAATSAPRTGFLAELDVGLIAQRETRLIEGVEAFSVSSNFS
jgi:hypothetical protein